MPVSVIPKYWELNLRLNLFSKSLYISAGIGPPQATLTGLSASSSPAGCLYKMEGIPPRKWKAVALYFLISSQNLVALKPSPMAYLPPTIIASKQVKYLAFTWNRGKGIKIISLAV